MQVWITKNSQQFQLTKFTRIRDHTWFETFLLHSTWVFFTWIMNMAIGINRSLVIAQSSSKRIISCIKEALIQTSGESYSNAFQNSLFGTKLEVTKRPAGAAKCIWRTPTSYLQVLCISVLGSSSRWSF